uniref:Uncharacterized protein n=1 Tax=Glossina pallidipes TaxID=7398 RepID=A0A1B0A628_GLOPL
MSLMINYGVMVPVIQTAKLTEDDFPPLGSKNHNTESLQNSAILEGNVEEVNTATGHREDDNLNNKYNTISVNPVNEEISNNFSQIRAINKDEKDIENELAPESILKEAFLAALKNNGKSLQLPLLTINAEKLLPLFKLRSSDLRAFKASFSNSFIDSCNFTANAFVTDLNRNYLQLFGHHTLVLCRNYRKETPAENLGVTFFVKNIGSNVNKWRAILKKYPALKTLKEKEVINTVEVLKKLNFNMDDIISKPTILGTGKHSLKNRYYVLKECGFNISISLLSRYLVAMNKDVGTLKSFNHIPYDLDVIEKLRQTFTDVDIQLPKDSLCNENIELKVLRQYFMSYYLQQRLHWNQNDTTKLWNAYGRIRHKSFYSVQKMIKLLSEELQFSSERISKNAFTLCADFQNVERILRDIPSIDGEDIRDILHKCPKIMMSPCDALITTLKYIKDYGIKEDAVLRCLEVLTLGPDTVLERLKDLNEVEEFQVLNCNPRVLRLVHYQNKARLRLEYLNQLKVRCVSLHILSCSSDTFARFARDGEDRTRGRDIVVYLAHVLDKDAADLRNVMSRHPNWCHIPIVRVKQCYEFLLNNEFSKADIYDNMHLLLYPIKRIDEKLQLLHSPEFLQQLQLDYKDPLSKKNILALTLYLIESEYHFTGDGVWAEQVGQQVENFKNLLPDFPEGLTKVCRYGTKPATAAIN